MKVILSYTENKMLNSLSSKLDTFPIYKYDNETKHKEDVERIELLISQIKNSKLNDIEIDYLNQLVAKFEYFK